MPNNKKNQRQEAPKEAPEEAKSNGKDSQDRQHTKGKEAQAIGRVDHRRIQGLKTSQGRTIKSVGSKRTHMCKKNMERTTEAWVHREMLLN